ncbi:15-hydroxyprostaglandin dehydrogenase [NAD(+)]-like [Glandiceps talaboti]
MNIDNKVAIVTGSARGIGKAIVEKLLEKGAKGVAILDVADEPGEESCKDFKEKFGQQKVIYIHCDVSVASDLEAAFSTAVKKFGGLDIVCNNAAIINEFDWERMIDVNQKGVIKGTYLAMDHMGVKNGGKGGVVINTASVIGLVPFPFLPVYSTTKHGIICFTRSVANEPRMKENEIRVAAVCPAKVDTDFTTDAANGSRYKDILVPAMDGMPATPMTQITDAVVKLIEDSDSNGKVCCVADNEAKFIEPQDNKF